MEFYINELSLHGQYHTQEDFELSVRQMTEVMSKVLGMRNATAFKKDLTVLQHQRVSENDYFVASFEKIRNKQLRDAFRGIIFNKLNPKNWVSERLHSEEDNFTCELLNDFVNSTTLAEVAERILQKPNVQRILVNFISPIFENAVSFSVNKNDACEVILNGITRTEHLSSFLQIFDTRTLYKQYLENTDFFTRTNFVYSGTGERIYRMKEDGSYWYFDFNHRENGKPHCEVFDSNENYLGTAVLGNLDGNFERIPAKGDERNRKFRYR
jgi:hypothetical protein